MTRNSATRSVAAGMALVVLAAGSAFVAGQSPEVLPPPPTRTPALLAPVVFAVPPIDQEPGTSAPSPQKETSLVHIAAEERKRLAAEMARWVTRNPHELVGVIADLAEKQALPLPPTFL